MAKIKLVKYPQDVYFKKTVNYELEVDGKSLTVCVEEDTNESIIHYIDADGDTLYGTPDWIIDIGEDEFGNLIFEEAVYENLHCMAVDEEIYTDPDDEL